MTRSVRYVLKEHLKYLVMFSKSSITKDTSTSVGILFIVVILPKQTYISAHLVLEVVR